MRSAPFAAVALLPSAAVSLIGVAVAVAAAKIGGGAIGRVGPAIVSVMALLVLPVVGGGGVLAVPLIMVLVFSLWRWQWSGSFDRWVAEPFKRWRRCAFYRREWDRLTAGHGLAGQLQAGRRSRDGEAAEVPALRRIECGRCADRLVVRPLVGQSIEQWERAAPSLAFAMGARSCRVATDEPGLLNLDVAWSDSLGAIVPALEVTAQVDLAAVPVGVREDGDTWTLCLVANHVLVAGVTGAGKSSVLWSLVRGLAPAVRDGSVQLWVIDPKGGMEFTPARPMVARFAAGDLEEMAELLEAAAEVMRERSSRYAAGHVRKHRPSLAEPLVVVLIDELAFLTAYAGDRKMRDAIGQSLATLLTQGRAVGVCVVGALQDPRKEVVGFRNLFPTKVALRLDERSQVDMVLGEGAREAGARCDRIPESLPGVGFVKVDGVREPVRVRAAFVTDADIAATGAEYAAPDALVPGVDESGAA